MRPEVAGLQKRECGIRPRPSPSRPVSSRFRRNRDDLGRLVGAADLHDQSKAVDIEQYDIGDQQVRPLTA